MKFDPAALRYLSDDDFRVLTAIEMGMRNHELVPIPLISVISGLRHGGYMRALKEVHKNKLVHKETQRYVGYRLTSMGYDYLALRALVKRGVVNAVGRAIGVGKEADVFVVTASEELVSEVAELAEDDRMAIKLHRLGRTSFRAVKSKRDYLVHRKSASWIYMSRLAAMKEYAFMCALHQRAFPVPRPIGQSRHVVVMELCKGGLLTQVRELPDAAALANALLDVIARFATHGLVHCDLNEFNIIVDEEGAFKVIDFPQMVSTSHIDAELLFERDVDGICRFFEHRFGVPEHELNRPVLADILSQRGDAEQLDAVVAASGFKNTADDEGDELHLVKGEEGEGGEDENEILHQIFKGTPSSSVAQAEAVSQSFAQRNSIQQADDSQDAVTSVEQTDDSQDAVTSVEQTGDSKYHMQDAGINHALIEARVRRQRANKSQRRQLARRNVVKDAEKRKVKNEVKSGFWD
eukprot:GFKZ01012871.1.p1 GENE.GFKZ01012871.1~~GFKZ01012871.1.p1  ORF type:complete len:465 (+),score=83.16 GFKZ01012871.1:773-2167(+)